MVNILAMHKFGKNSNVNIIINDVMIICIVICICTGKESSLVAKNKSTLVQYIPLGSSIKNDCAIGCLFT